MHTFIVLLRGINVSGQKQIKMADLKQYLEELKFESVQTYIQSGNLVVKSEEEADQVNSKINEMILAKYGFDVEMVMIKPTELLSILTKNPFKQNEDKKLYFTFLAEKPDVDNIAKLKRVDYSPELHHIANDLVYVFAANGYGKAKLNNNFIEKKLKVAATTRNLNTMNKLLEMSKLSTSAID
mgnify:CR=1 FL=1